MTSNRQGRLTKSMDTLFPQSAPDECRVCSEPVVDGRWSYCSTRCRRIARAVQRMFVWDIVREQVLERDDYTCQHCGISKTKLMRGYRQTRDRIYDQLADVDDDKRHQKRRELEERYNPTKPSMNVDHITRLADGGHPFEETNLQTLCERCHRAKTAAENRTETDTAEADAPDITLGAYIDERDA